MSWESISLKDHCNKNTFVEALELLVLNLKVTQGSTRCNAVAYLYENQEQGIKDSPCFEKV